MSLSEAVSNISSPDYQDQDDMFDTGRECPRMELSDPSDSDSTILVSEPCHKRAKSNSSYSEHGSDVTLNGERDKDYRIVIQVKGPEKSANANDNVNNNNNSTGYAQNGKENGHNSPENQGYQVGNFFFGIFLIYLLAVVHDFVRVKFLPCHAVNSHNEYVIVFAPPSPNVVP